MTPQERAGLTQEQRDAIMSTARAGELFRRGGDFYVTVRALREFEHLLAKPLLGDSPYSHEARLMHAVWATGL